MIRDPFFDGMIHEDDDDDEDDDSGFRFDDFNGPRQDPFDDAFRFGFSFGPGGARFEEPQVFGQIFRDMEEIFAGLGQFDEHSGFGRKGLFALFLKFVYFHILQGFFSCFVQSIHLTWFNLDFISGVESQIY